MRRSELVTVPDFSPQACAGSSTCAPASTVSLERIKALGFIPWVTDGQVGTVGVGSVELVPRRVLVVYYGGESLSLNYSSPHRFLQMPLNHMGYVVDYADVRNPLPEGVLQDRYAGVVTWFSGYLPEGRVRTVSQ